MLKRIMPIVQTVVIAAVIFSLSVTCFVKPMTEYSNAERRALNQFPELSLETLINGEFMNKFEDYSTDQFPLRDFFRGVKGFSEMHLFNKSDNNGYYTVDGSVSRTEYPLSPEDISFATNRFKQIYDLYLNENNHVYMSVIPDKNAFVADDLDYLTLDYNALYSQVITETSSFAEYIDITGLLELGDYYNTDTHWRQDKIVDVAKALANAMGTDIPDEYTENTVDQPFYGVHFYQSAIPFLQADTITYLTNEIIDGCEVINYDNDKGMPEPIPMYDTDKASGEDAYEMFLSGPLSLLTITNPNADTDKELVIFRDSFGSSISPLLAQGYAKVTVVDIRYIMIAPLRFMVKFQNADVLFLYSTLVLNQSMDTFKQ